MRTTRRIEFRKKFRRKTDSNQRSRPLTTLVTFCMVFCFALITALPMCGTAMAATDDQAAMARKLQLEGTQLQLKGDKAGAIEKYQESIAQQPNQKLENLIQTLQKGTAPGSPAVQAEPTVVEETVPQAVEAEFIQAPTMEEAAAAATVAVVEEAATEAAAVTAPVERTPGTPEEELIYAFTDWFLELLPEKKEGVEMGLVANRNYTISKTDGSYEVRFDKFTLYFTDDFSSDLSPVVFHFTPQDKDRLAVQLLLPEKIALSEGADAGVKLVILKREVSGIWNRQYHDFEKTDILLGDITLSHTEEPGHVFIEEIKFSSLSAADEKGIWEEKIQGSMSGLSMDVEDVKFGIHSISGDYNLTGTNYTRYRELRNAFNEAMMNLDDESFDIASLKGVFADLDEYIKLFDSSSAKGSIMGVVGTAAGEGGMGLDSIEFAGTMNRDAKTNRYLMESTGSFKGFSMSEEKKENGNPLSATIAELSFSDKGVVNQIPPTLFADIFTAIEGAEKATENMEAYAAEKGIGFAKTIFKLFANYSGEMTLKGLAVYNAMPETVSVESLTLGSGFDAGSGDGGKIFTLISFSGFRGIDMGQNNIPKDAKISLELSNIPNLLNLISDSSAIASGGGDAAKQQVMMNGMGTLMKSTLSLSLTDSFVAFPTSRINLGFQAMVNGGAKFMSTGNLKLVLENPDEFARIVKSFGVEQEAEQVLGMLTMLASRTDVDGKVVDTIDAEVTQEGKIMVNKKDVTGTFFPGQGEAGGEPAGSAPAVPAQ